MKKTFASLALVTALTACGQGTATQQQPTQAATTNPAGLILPAGFSSEKIIEGLTRPRHLVVGPQNKLYVKLERKMEGAGLLVYDLNSPKPALVQRFGNYTGTGVAVQGNQLFASSDDDVFRYELDAKGLVTNADQPVKVVQGLWNKGQHASKSIALDGAGNLYVNVGAPSNSCQVDDRQNGSPGQMPCPILENAGGIWRFKAGGNEQGYSAGSRYATGLRNVVGLDWNAQQNALWVMQHGRDQLAQNWGQFFDKNQGANNPAETLYKLSEGANAGWPYTYYNYDRKLNMQAPEYGGDGNMAAKDSFLQPAAAYPAHMAPNGLLFYTGNQFPARYRNGAFIAFHGSWNRSPLPQEGYYVVFQPFENGKPTDKWEVFADGFAGEKKTPGGAKHRPCGLAQDAAGNLYVSDDAGGAIFKISYTEGK